MKKIIVGITAILLCVIGIAIRMLVRHPEWFSQKQYEMTGVITYEDVNYSITKIEKLEEYNNTIPRDGYEFVVITVKIENNSDKIINPNNDSWSMGGTSPQTGMSMSFDEVIMTIQHASISSHESGEIKLAFEAIEDAQDTYLSVHKNANMEKGNTFRFLLNE